jgi:CspA family cold shock protein
MGDKVTGLVKWFDARKGYGFINAKGYGEKDIFIYWDQINMQGYKTLKTGQKVTVEVIETDKGLQAKNVDLVE